MPSAGRIGSDGLRSSIAAPIARAAKTGVFLVS
jgi:hypothetical protein